MEKKQQEKRHMDHKFSDIRRYISNHTLYCKDGIPPTHLHLDGGKFYIPSYRHSEFLNKYHLSLKMNQNYNSKVNINYISEVRTDPIFRLYMDMDITSADELDPIGYVKTIHKTIMEMLWYRNNPEKKLDRVTGRMIVLCAKSKKLLKGVKTGVHLIWPGIHVDQETVLWLRSGVLQRLVYEYGERKEDVTENPWEDVIDSSVYDKGKGLRMIGSWKAERCKVCLKESIDYDCSHCGNANFFGENRPYEFRMLLDSNGNDFKSIEINKIIEYMYEKPLCQKFDFEKFIVFESSIRLVNNKSGKSIVATEQQQQEEPNVLIKHMDISSEWYRKENYDDLKNENKRKQNKAKQRNKQLREENETPQDKKSMEQIIKKNPVSSVEDKRCLMVQKFIRTNFKAYNHIEILDLIELQQRGGDNHVYIVKTNERYCLNIGDEHSSNHIYFTVTPTGIRQKCHADKVYDNGRTCANYASMPVILTKKLKNALFTITNNDATNMVATENIVIDPTTTPKITNQERKKYYLDNLRVMSMVRAEFTKQSAQEKRTNRKRKK